MDKATEYLSLAGSIIACFVTAFGLIKVLVGQYFKKANELEDLKSSNNEKFKTDIEAEFTQLHSHLNKHSTEIAALKADMQKAVATIQGTESKSAVLAQELERFRDKRSRIDKLETEVKEIKDVYLFIKDKINPKP